MIKYHCKDCGIDTEKSECAICLKRADVESKLYWCSHCNIPTYDKVCPICMNEGEYFAKDARPVFPEERLLIEALLGKPLAFINSSVWKTTGNGNQYCVDGKKIKFLMSTLLDVEAKEIKKILDTHEERNNSTYFKQNIKLFIAANKSRYNYICSEAIDYIKDIAKNYDSSDMFVSFSGGKDSTVVSDLVVRALNKPEIIHIFGDTTLEFPETAEYLERFKSVNRRTPVLTSKNSEQDFFEMCKLVGPPSRLLRWCCAVFKTGTISRKIQITFKNKTRILTFYGIRRSESNSRKSYERNSESPKISKQKVSSPIIDWFDYEIWLYILTTGIDFNTAYKLGYSRVGCWCCPNNSKWAQFLSSVYMPVQYNRFKDLLIDFAKNMGKNDPEVYVKQGGWKARQGGAGIELSKKVVIPFTPCASEEDTFDYELNKPIDDELHELFKPFGWLSKDMGNPRLGEVYVLGKDGTPILKIQGRAGTKRLRVSILKLPIAGTKRLIEAELKVKCQITKFQLCLGCRACEGICKHNAISLKRIDNAGETYTYSIDDEKCTRCGQCINHFNGGCYMRRVLLPRGELYGL